MGPWVRGLKPTDGPPVVPARRTNPTGRGRASSVSLGGPDTIPDVGTRGHVRRVATRKDELRLHYARPGRRPNGGLRVLRRWVSAYLVLRGGTPDREFNMRGVESSRPNRTPSPATWIVRVNPVLRAWLWPSRYSANRRNNTLGKRDYLRLIKPLRCRSTGSLFFILQHGRAQCESHLLTIEADANLLAQDVPVN